jgi:hypothetical protein
LELFSLTASLKNDKAAFEIETIRNLTLVTGSKAAVPSTPQFEMERVCLTDRPGLDIGQKWPNVSWLRIGKWGSHNLGSLERANLLEEVYIEAKRQAGGLEGIETLSQLRVLKTINYSVQSLAPLSSLELLQEVRLMSARPSPPHEPFDLSALRSPMLQRLWVSNCPNFLHLEALAELPRLREVRFVDCQLSAADRDLLATLPSRVSVQLVN